MGGGGLERGALGHWRESWLLRMYSFVEGLVRMAGASCEYALVVGPGSRVKGRGMAESRKRVSRLVTAVYPSNGTDNSCVRKTSWLVFRS